MRVLGRLGLGISGLKTGHGSGSITFITETSSFPSITYIDLNVVFFFLSPSHKLQPKRQH